MLGATFNTESTFDSLLKISPFLLHRIFSSPFNVFSSFFFHFCTPLFLLVLYNPSRSSKASSYTVLIKCHSSINYVLDVFVKRFIYFFSSNLETFLHAPLFSNYLHLKMSLFKSSIFSSLQIRFWKHRYIRWKNFFFQTPFFSEKGNLANFSPSLKQKLRKRNGINLGN